MLGYSAVLMRVFAACAMFAATSAAVAQPAQLQNPPSQPDVAILATVHANYLRFDEKPEVSVTFPGQEKNQTVWRSERTNLPQQVEPHVIYRDIGLRLTITSTLPNIEQIVDEALAPPSPQPALQPKKPKRKPSH